MVYITRSKYKCGLCCILVTLICFFACLSWIQLFTLENDVSLAWGEIWKENRLHSKTSHEKGLKGPDIKITHPIVLWWTPFTGQSGQYRECGKNTCYFTENRAFTNHSMTEVFMFYGSNFKPLDLPLPRQSHHEWALFHEESPKNNMMFCYGDTMELFNHTATFRQISDFPLTLQYLKDLKSLTGTEYFVPLQQKNKLLEKIAPVLYIHSDCDTPSGRDKFVKELMKYIAVDSYGKCLHNKDLPMHLHDASSGMDHPDLLRIAAQYKFTLAFENAACEDYITEKLWRPLTVGSVPIYFGAPNIVEWLPNENSAILVENFKDAPELAKFIKKLNDNDFAYNEYLLHKFNGSITNENLLSALEERQWGINDDAAEKGNFVDHFECFICDRIHKRQLAKSKGYNDVTYKANEQHYGCPSPESPNSFDSDQSWWVEQYKKAEIKALVLKQLLARNLNFTAKDYYDRIINYTNYTFYLQKEDLDKGL